MSQDNLKFVSPLFTVKETAKYLRVCERTIHNYKKQGKLRQLTNVGRNLLFHKDDLDAFIEQGRQSIEPVDEAIEQGHESAEQEHKSAEHKHQSMEAA
jgi:excisionase family DNA binding protein